MGFNLLFPSKPHIKSADKRLLRTYYCPSTYHGARNCARQDVFKSKTNRSSALMEL